VAFRKVVPSVLTTLALVTLLTLRPQDVLAHQASPGSIVGTVRDQEGGNVTAAEVALVYPQQAILRTTVTDASGHFSFESIPVGAYEVRITRIISSN
jgi:protocatechuate 3,4-dioxygenase beta subunit